MEGSYLKFRSVTQAIKAQNLLKKFRIKSQLRRTSDLKSGCGFKINFNHDIDKVKNLLIENKIKFLE